MRRGIKLLPEFEKPPVVEVAVSVQFNPPVLNGPLLMLWWIQVRDRFPKFELAAPLPSSIETFEGPQEPRIDFRISDAPPTPRLLMVSESDTEVIQIQENIFGCSWRKLSPEHEYPRYEDIRDKFHRELTAFQTFLRDEGLGHLSPAQCEVTYVNVIQPEGISDIHSDLGKIIPSATPRLTEGFLPAPEQTRYSSQYIIPGAGKVPLGRLHVRAQPSYLLSDKTPMYLLTLTFRGCPQGSDTAAIIETMGLGHEWIVRGFATLTSSEMHRIWRRTK